MTLVPDLASRLARLDSCAVSDALDKLGLNGVALGLHALSTTHRIAGRAITVTLGPADGRASDRHLGTAAVEAGAPGTVIVVQHDGRCDVAGWGGILSLGAKTKGVEGIVIDGACRDLDEATAMSLPIYGRAGVARTARGRIIEYAWNETIAICGIPVSPGDYVIADASGVAVIPADLAAGVIAAAERILRKEQLMADAVRAGRPMSEVMGADYEKMLQEPVTDDR